MKVLCFCIMLGSYKDVDEQTMSHEEDNKINCSTTSDSLSWAKSWVSSVHNHRQCFASGLPLPIPNSGLRFAALVDVLPLPQIVTPLYRYGIYNSITVSVLTMTAVCYYKHQVMIYVSLNLNVEPLTIT